MLLSGLNIQLCKIVHKRLPGGSDGEPCAGNLDSEELKARWLKLLKAEEKEGWQNKSPT